MEAGALPFVLNGGKYVCNFPPYQQTSVNYAVLSKMQVLEKPLRPLI